MNLTRAGLGLLLAAILAGCTGGGPILANPTPPRPAPPSVSPSPSRPADPLPVVLPQDDRPHDRLTEWWYYTGHLRDGSGGRWGFEFVIFRAERGSFPVSWASHLALTDERSGTFRYDQRSEIGPQVDRSPGAGDGFALTITGLAPTLIGAGQGQAGPGPGPGSSATPPSPAGSPGALTPWLMGGLNGRDRLLADSSTAGFGLNLELVQSRAPALHDRDGWVDFGPAGGSYYYSRTRMSAAGLIKRFAPIR